MTAGKREFTKDEGEKGKNKYTGKGVNREEEIYVGGTKGGGRTKENHGKKKFEVTGEKSEQEG